MEIAINHLTRMSPGRICVAGIDTTSGMHVRPLPPGGSVVTADLERNGGPYDIGNVVDLGTVVSCPQRPKLEDHNYATAKLVRTTDPVRFYHHMQQMAVVDLQTLFGPALVITPNAGAYLPPSQGNASLGCLLPTDAKPQLFANTFNQKVKLRINLPTTFAGNAVSLNLSVTDIRMYLADHSTPDVNAIPAFNQRLKTEPFILGIGVGYLMNATLHNPAAHWLQVNALHFEADPIRKLN